MCAPWGCMDMNGGDLKEIIGWGAPPCPHNMGQPEMLPQKQLFNKKILSNVVLEL